MELPVGRHLAAYADGSIGPVEVVQLVPEGHIGADGVPMERLIAVADPLWREGAIGVRPVMLALPSDWHDAGHRLLPGSSPEELAARPRVPSWLARALGEVGVRELPGSASNPRVLEYHRIAGTGAASDADAWCGAFVGWVAQHEGLGLPDKPGVARSWLKWGNPVDAHVGAVCVLWRESPESWKGHVGFVVASRDGRVWLLGGNQADQVCIQSFPAEQVLGCRWP